MWFVSPWLDGFGAALVRCCVVGLLHLGVVGAAAPRIVTVSLFMATLLAKNLMPTGVGTYKLYFIPLLFEYE